MFHVVTANRRPEAIIFENPSLAIFATFGSGVTEAPKNVLAPPKEKSGAIDGVRKKKNWHLSETWQGGGGKSKVGTIQRKKSTDPVGIGMQCRKMLRQE